MLPRSDPGWPHNFPRQIIVAGTAIGTPASALFASSPGGGMIPGA